MTDEDVVDAAVPNFKLRHPDLGAFTTIYEI